MNRDVTLAEPTSSATTRQTEPEVIAGIASGDIRPHMPTGIRSRSRSRSRTRSGFGLGALALLLVGGAAMGYGVSRWLRT